MKRNKTGLAPEPHGGDGSDEEVQVDTPGREELVTPTSSPPVWWDPRPVTRPVLHPGFLDLPAPQRGVEVILHWMARTEHWLSPGGWLRAWVRLNVILAVLLAVSAFTVVPVVTVVLEGIGGWTSQLGLLSEDVGLAMRGLPPIAVTVCVVLLGIHLFRRHRSRQFRRGYPSYEEFE